MGQEGVAYPVVLVAADEWQVPALRTPQPHAGALYLAAGRDVYEVVERGVAAAARLSGTAKPRGQKAVPPSVDLFGWCTWVSVGMWGGEGRG
jgi:hypothetical protein